MLVFLDVGNSQLKVAVYEKQEYRLLSPISHKEIEEQDLSTSFNLNSQNIEGVYLATVASADLNAVLQKKIQQEWKVYPTLLTTEPSCCGITCGYESHEQLGVDRWMAIIGSCANSSKPTFIVDAGTALTVDVVIDKQHLGGFIVPGLGVLRQSLIDHTTLPQCILSSAEEGSDLLGKNTATGVMGGTLYMAASYLNSLLADLEKETGRKFDCIGTGGDFKRLKPLMDKPFEYIEDLTLQGMVEVIESL